MRALEAFIIIAVVLSLLRRGARGAGTPTARIPDWGRPTRPAPPPSTASPAMPTAPTAPRGVPMRAPLRAPRAETPGGIDPRRLEEGRTPPPTAEPLHPR